MIYENWSTRSFHFSLFTITIIFVRIMHFMIVLNICLILFFFRLNASNSLKTKCYIFTSLCMLRYFRWLRQINLFILNMICENNLHTTVLSVQQSNFHQQSVFNTLITYEFSFTRVSLFTLLLLVLVFL